MKRYFIILLMFSACVEPFDFDRKNSDPQLVIEAYVSDISFTESMDAPSNGRYFEVKLKWSRPVASTVLDSITPFADVRLIDNDDNEWQYHETSNEWGTYTLFDPDFKACEGQQYKLQITLRDDLVYESDWETLPALKAPPVEDIWFDEYTVKNYYYAANEQKIGLDTVIDISTKVPPNPEGEERFYRWTFDPYWVYEAPLATGQFAPYRTCWAKNENYLDEYALEEDYVGDVDKKLFRMRINRNERIYYLFSTMVSQQVVSRNFYYFNQLMQQQTRPNGIFDSPPANLPSNFTCINDPSKNPIGYFGVVSESQKRWYFQKDELSFFVKDNSLAECNARFNRPQDDPDPAPECEVCLLYTNGTATLNRPDWWPEF